MIIGWEWLYEGFFVIGIAACVFFVLPRIMKRYDMSKKANDFYTILTLIAIAAGIGGAILFQLIYDLFEYGFKLPSGYSPGMTFLGGLIVGAAAFLIGTRFVAKPEVRKEFWIILRCIAPCVCIAHAFGRIGCLFGGCCYGIEMDGFPGIWFPAGSNAANHLNGGAAVCVLPTQLFEAVFLFILFYVCYRFNEKSLITYLISYGVFRFIIEFFRADHRGELLWQTALSPSQVLSIGMVILGVVLLILDIKKKGILIRPDPPEKKPEDMEPKPAEAQA